MPLYEFDCKKCDATVEILVRSPDESAKCPDCGNTKLVRLMSATAKASVSGGSAKSSSLPMAGSGEPCGAPRCCGGGCQM